jgi:hypothetical protein
VKRRPSSIHWIAATEATSNSLEPNIRSTVSSCCPAAGEAQATSVSTAAPRSAVRARRMSDSDRIRMLMA